MYSFFDFSSSSLFLPWLGKLLYKPISSCWVQKSYSFSKSFIFIFIFVSISQKIGPKPVIFFYFLIFMKIRLKPNFKMEGSKGVLIFPNFIIYIYLFSAQLMKNWSKSSQLFFFLRFSWKFVLWPKFRVESSKIGIIFWNFFIFSVTFVSMSRKSFKNESKNFSLSWKLVYNLIVGWWA